MKLGLGLGLLSGGSRAFTPLSLPGAALWVRADKGSPTGALWLDQSGNGKNLTQATVGLQPTVNASWKNGHPGLVWSNTAGTLMASPAFAGGDIAHSTIFIVASYGSANTDQILCDGLTGTKRNLLELNQVGNQYDLYAGTGVVATAITVDTKVHRFGASFNLGSSLAYIDGTSYPVNLTSQYPMDGLTLGNAYAGGTANASSSTIGEVVIYNRVLSAAEYAQLDAYALAFWGSA